jgi:hypothetical protein
MASVTFVRVGTPAYPLRTNDNDDIMDRRKGYRTVVPNGILSMREDRGWPWAVWS